MGAAEQLGAWERLKGRSQAPLLWAAFVGGRTDPAGVQRLLEGRDRGLYAAATLGAGAPADAWREHLVGSTEAQLEELLCDRAGLRRSRRGPGPRV